jgi:hypothetical protein
MRHRSRSTGGAVVDVSANSGGLYGTNEPGVSMHPLNPLLALDGGNTYSPTIHANIESSSDGGNTWLRQASANNSGTGDGVPAMLGDIQP